MEHAFYWIWRRKDEEWQKKKPPKTARLCSEANTAYLLFLFYDI